MIYRFTAEKQQASLCKHSFSHSEINHSTSSRPILSLSDTGLYLDKACRKKAFTIALICRLYKNIVRIKYSHFLLLNVVNNLGPKADG